MAQRCTICDHPQSNAIDALIVADKVSVRDISARYSVASSTVQRHKDHIAKTMAKAQEAQVMTRADTLVAKALRLEEDARRIATAAEETGDLRTALTGIRELTRICELQAKMAGEIKENTVNIAIVNNPEWIDLRGRILRVLEQYPEAMAAVVKEISE